MLDSDITVEGCSRTDSFTTSPNSISLFGVELQLNFESRDYKIEEMMFQVHLMAWQLDVKYELDGRNIDEEL